MTELVANLRGEPDMTLNGPTTLAWLREWKRYLKQQGVKFFVGKLGELDWYGDERSELVPIPLCRRAWVDAKKVRVRITGNDPGDYTISTPDYIGNEYDPEAETENRKIKMISTSDFLFTVTAKKGESASVIAKTLAEYVDDDPRFKADPEGRDVVIERNFSSDQVLLWVQRKAEDKHTITVTINGEAVLCEGERGESASDIRDRLLKCLDKKLGSLLTLTKEADGGLVIGPLSKSPPFVAVSVLGADAGTYRIRVDGESVEVVIESKRERERKSERENLRDELVKELKNQLGLACKRLAHTGILIPSERAWDADPPPVEIDNDDSNLSLGLDVSVISDPPNVLQSSCMNRTLSPGYALSASFTWGDMCPSKGRRTE